MASPPSLVMLGLTLPDSRILYGIASIGLTLANIAIILPYLRQPVLDSMSAREGELADEQYVRGHTESSLDTSHPVKVESPVDLILVHSEESRSPPTTSITEHPIELDAENPAIHSESPPDKVQHSPCLVQPDAEKSPVSSPDKDHQSPSLVSGTVYPVELDLGSPVISSPDRERESPTVAPRTVPPLELNLENPDSVSSLGMPLTAGVRSMVVELESLGIDRKLTPSPVPTGTTDDGQTLSQICCPPEADSLGISMLMPEGLSVRHIPLPALDAAFFDSTEAIFSYTNLQEQHSKAACNGRPISKDSHADDNIVPIPTKVVVRAAYGHVVEDVVSSLPDALAASGGTDLNVQAGFSAVEGQEVLRERRPESLEFIPQSVISRYPSVPQAIISGDIGQLPHILIQNPEMLLEGAKPRARYTILEGHWPAPFLTEILPTTQATGGTTLVIETAPVQGTLEQGQTSSTDPPPVHEPTPLRKHPFHRRRLGVLARAALRSRRFAARRYENSAYDDSSSSDSDSESDSDSQSSSGPSADESMLPRMLGADLIAAINYNSESELNNLGSGKTIPAAPLDVYCDFLASEDSVADVSMIMHMSTLDGAPNSEVRATATSRALTHEDIRQWATGVVQKCVRQVCRDRSPMEPLSPSQASDVCAERPSSAGISQCPLSGLHCKLGAATSAHAPTPRVDDISGPHSPASTSQAQRLLSARNIRDIPEFVPRQRPGLSIAGREARVPGTKVGARSAIGVMGDAAAEVIARMESQAGFNVCQRLAGASEGQMVGMAAGQWQGTTRRAY